MRRRGFLALIGLGAAGAAGGVIPAAAVPQSCPAIAPKCPANKSGVIDGGLIVVGSITAAKIEAGSILAEKIEVRA